MDDIIIQLQKFVPGGQTIGILPDGKRMFVWGGLPGEKVKVEITKSKSSYAEGFVKNVIESSPRRIDPKDECYLSTSPWQIMDYEYELEQKTKLINEAYMQQKVDLHNNELRTITTDNKEFFYRNKMEYSLYWNNDKEKVELAFHKRGSHQKVPTSSSSIERPEILAIAKNIIDDINTQNFEARMFSSLMIRSNQDGDVRSLLFEKNKPHIQGKSLTDTIAGHEYTYSPNGFFQINLPVYEMALQQMNRYVKDGSVLELYAGVGTIGLSIAKNNNLTIVESDKSAYKELENNVARFDKSNITTINAKSEDILDYLTNDVNTLILDPPRAGLDAKVIQKTLQTFPSTIIYLSCNPITQARDIKHLLGKYKITHIEGFNFFPRTPHIENLIVLSQ